MSNQPSVKLYKQGRIYRDSVSEGALSTLVGLLHSPFCLALSLPFGLMHAIKLLKHGREEKSAIA